MAGVKSAEAVANGAERSSCPACWGFPVEPWYMFLYLGTVAGSRVNLTMLVAWEESLLDIVDAVPAQDHMVVYRVERGQSNSLVFKNVHRLWVPTAEESAQGIGAVLEVDGVFGVVDPDMRPLASDECRTLV